MFHLPFRYLDRTRVTPIAQLQPNTNVVIQGTVHSTQILFGRRRSLVCRIEDNTGSTSLRFYHFNGAQKDKLEKGSLLRCYGEPRLGSTGLEFYHPEYDFIDLSSPAPTEENLTPIYHLTEGITQLRLRKLVKNAMDIITPEDITDLLPVHINQYFQIENLIDAIRYMHFPPSNAQVEDLIQGTHNYQQRFIFEELLAHFLIRRQLRDAIQSEVSPKILPHLATESVLRESLSFTLTNAQEKTIHDIRNDFAKNKTMLRMVQGDVGSGKTLVAMIAAIHAIKSGYQVAVVAPTEILAEQHRQNFTALLSPLEIKVGWLVGKLTPKNRRLTLEQIAQANVDIVIGTHALFQDDVFFKQLGLVIIDEQHRFGVQQRLSLKQKSLSGETPHQLVMTATPIPRTLAMTAYSELDYSIIDELPPGRTPINTVLISQSRRAEIIERIKVACANNTQVYWVCTLVEESETLAAANAEETYDHLKNALPNINVGLVHGRLNPKNKEAVMADFKQNNIQLLIATTVIEVGVDVPNASLMVIENPERLGLAQLHQLRGRVGRGTTASHCVLLYGNKLSLNGKERLKVLRESCDGFVIAQKDLELRGPGELIGTRQTGDMAYKLADIQRDGHLLSMIHDTGNQIFNDSPDTVEAILQRWFGDDRAYAQV